MAAKYGHNILIGVVNSLEDQFRVLNGIWYRIPVEKAPPELIGGNIAWLVPYWTQALRTKPLEAVLTHRIPVLDTIEVSRLELFPDEAENAKSKSRYFKLSLGQPEILKSPIANSPGYKRLVFATTNLYKLTNASTLAEVIKDDVIS